MYRFVSNLYNWTVLIYTVNVTSYFKLDMLANAYIYTYAYSVYVDGTCTSVK